MSYVFLFLSFNLIQEFDDKISKWVDGNLRLPSGRNPQITLSERSTTNSGSSVEDGWQARRYGIERPEGFFGESGTDLYRQGGEYLLDAGHPYNGRTVSNPGGSSVKIDIPNNYLSEPTFNGKGTLFRIPGSTGNANTIRMMNPTSHYPKGYAVFYNHMGQAFDPNTGKTLGKAFWHFSFH